MIFNGKFRFILQLNPNLPQMKIKQLLLFVCLSSLTLSFTACSGDDNKETTNNSQGTFSFKLDGVQKNFDNLVITKEAPDEDGDVLITVIASEKAHPETYFTFETFEGQTGTAGISYTEYVIAGERFFPGPGAASVEVNSNGILKGNFRTDIQERDRETTEYVTLYKITEGYYDLKIK